MLHAVRQTLFVLIALTLHLPVALAIGVDSPSTAAEPASETLSAAVESGALEAAPSGSLTPGRMGLYESALMPREGLASWTALNLGVHRFDYAVSDHVQVGLTTVIPIGVAVAVPDIKFGTSLTEDLHLAVTARVGGLMAPTGSVLMTYGGNALLTYGDADYHLTAGVHAYGVSVPGRGSDAAWIVHPSIGGVFRLADFALAHVDLGPTLIGATGAGDPETLFAFKYGVRFHGDNCFGDVAFLIPGVEEWSEMAQILPLGLPTLTFGYAF